jgi:ribosome-associated translation inhibitor RaiA
MNIEFRFRGLTGQRELRDFLKQQIAELEDHLPITTALVVVEYQRGVTPAYWIYVRLAVPGKDVFTCGRDHTPLAAWLKVSRELQREIKRRKARLVHKRKSNLQLRRAQRR